jgi:hypothetical protein
MPMAVKYVVAWTNSVVSFLRMVWSDENYSDDARRLLTRWVGEDLIPACPRGLWYHEIGNNVSRAGATTVLSVAMASLIAFPNRERANSFLRTLAESLGINDDDYLSITTNAMYVASSADSELNEGTEWDETQEKAIARAVMQNAMYHYRNKSLSALAYSRFRALGFFENITAPDLPKGLIERLRQASKVPEENTESGRLIFVPEEKSVTLIELDDLMLHPDSDLRAAAFEYLNAVGKSTVCWLTPHTTELVEKAIQENDSTDEEVWRGAAMEAATAFRDDVLALFASLRTSIARNYQPGMQRFSSEILHPELRYLLHFRPPVWNPVEQWQEIGSWIAEFAQLDTIDDALSAYLDRCGYVPLSSDLSASALAIKWIESHSELEMTWNTVWDWATRQKTPVARYHALEIAITVPGLFPNHEPSLFWAEVARILQDVNDKDESEDFGHRWRLHCELGAHFARHLEALHPAQNGDSVACYAWWLATRVSTLFGRDERSAQWATDNVLLPAARVSYFRWVAARSPVSTSPMRYLTLHVNSVWTVSLLAQIGTLTNAVPAEGLSVLLMEMLGRVLHGYVLTTPLAHTWGDAKVPFAFQQNAAVEKLCSNGYVQTDVAETVSVLISFRRQLSSPDQAQSYLGEFGELPLHMQHVVLLALRDLVYSTSFYDKVIEQWLEQGTGVTSTLKDSPDEIVDLLLEIFSEFQQHQIGNWSIRLPHLLVNVIEESQDSDRVNLLASHVLQLSENAGIASPIQRLAASGRWSKWSKAIESWRDNCLAMAKHSAPWVGCRTRSISATVSKLVGPRRLDQTHDGEQEWESISGDSTSADESS